MRKDVGRTFWKHGDYKNIPGLEFRANDGDHEDGGLPCEMLTYKDGKAVCSIELIYGRKYKPKVCRDYPFDVDFKTNEFRKAVNHVGFTVVNPTRFTRG